MTREERIAAIAAEMPETCRSAVQQLLRALVHDINGALSAVNMEAFTIEQLVGTLASRPSTQQSGRQMEILMSSAANLKRAVTSAANYLERIEALADEISK